MAGKLYLFFGKSVEEEEDDYTGNSDAERDRMNHFIFRLANREIPPAFKVVREEVLVCVAPDHLGMPLAQECKSPADCGDVDCLPQPIQNQDLPVQDGRMPVEDGRKYHLGRSVSNRWLDGFVSGRSNATLNRRFLICGWALYFALIQYDSIGMRENAQ